MNKTRTEAGSDKPVHRDPLTFAGCKRSEPIMELRLPKDGILGTNTSKAVRCFERLSGLDGDGSSQSRGHVWWKGSASDTRGRRLMSIAFPYFTSLRSRPQNCRCCNKWPPNLTISLWINIDFKANESCSLLTYASTLRPIDNAL
jgi:hypothetical protein